MTRRRACSIRAIGVLLAGALIAPAATTAADGPARLAFIQGIAGKRVDICIGGKEITSGLRYGKVAFKTRRSGTPKLKVFKRDPRRCKGRKLAQARLTLEAGHDYSIAITRTAPKIVLFPNEGLGDLEPAVTVSIALMRHAADLGPADIYLHGGPGDPWRLAADPTFTKGQQTDRIYLPSTGVELISWATRVGKRRAIAGPVQLVQDGGAQAHRHEIYLVGNKAKNARFVTITRPTSGVRIG